MNFPEKLEAHRKLVAELERRQAELDAQRMGELAELPARFGFVNLDDFLRALRAATRAKDGPRVRKFGSVRTRRQSAQAKPEVRIAPQTQTDAASVVQTPPQVVKPAPVTPTWPQGNSLADPKNFGRRPDRAVFERGALSAEVHRSMLAEAMKFATQVLHTSKVPAQVWREWRAYERELQGALQATIPGAV
jgi:hypothetical protein